MNPRITRRSLFAAGAAGLAAWMTPSFRSLGIAEERSSMQDKQQATLDDKTQAATEGRLLSRPGTPKASATPGLHSLGIGTRRDGYLYIPTSYQADRPAPLVVMLHGAGGASRHGLAPFQQHADKAGLLLLAPDARRQTWDVIQDRRFGPDIAFLDRALAHTFARCSVDPRRIAAEGFSDGASYALSIAVTNGDLFSHVIAFSPGFMAPAGAQGKPRFFVSHGTHDQVLSIDACSRRIVPRLKRAGYDVTYQEFDGPHTVPPAIARQALDWFLA